MAKVQVKYSFAPSYINENGNMFWRADFIPDIYEMGFTDLTANQSAYVETIDEFRVKVTINGVKGFIKQFRLNGGEYYDVITFEAKPEINGPNKNSVVYLAKINWAIYLTQFDKLWTTKLFFDRIPMPYLPSNQTSTLTGLSEIVNRYKVDFKPYKKININTTSHRVMLDSNINRSPGLSIQLGSTTTGHNIWSPYFYAIVKPNQANANDVVRGLYLVPIPSYDKVSNFELNSIIDTWQNLEATQQIIALPFDLVNANRMSFIEITRNDISGTPNEQTFAKLYNARDVNNAVVTKLYAIPLNSVFATLNHAPARVPGSANNMSLRDFWQPFAFATDALTLSSNVLHSKKININDPSFAYIYFGSVFLENTANKTEFMFAQAKSLYQSQNTLTGFEPFATDGIEFGLGYKQLGREIGADLWFQPYDTLPLFTSNYLSNQQTIDKQFQIFNDKTDANLKFDIARQSVSMITSMITGFLGNVFNAVGAVSGMANAGIGIGQSVVNANFAKDSARLDYEANKQKAVIPTPSRILRTNGLTMWNSVLNDGDIHTLNYEIFSKGVIFDAYGTIDSLRTGKMYNSYKIRDNTHNYYKITKELAIQEAWAGISQEFYEWLYKKLVDGLTFFEINNGAQFGDFSTYEWL